MDAARTMAGGDARIASLDQFRGYTVFGMVLVNFVGAFSATPAIFKHHNTYLSYADTIMPQFFFAVGFAYRLVYLRRARAMDPAALRLRFVRRSLGLIAVGALLYGVPGVLEGLSASPRPSAGEIALRVLRTDIFQALVHIALTSLWILPVIGSGAAARAAFAAASAGLGLLLSQAFYYDWVMTAPGIDGGPLGFLTWTVPTLAGSFAYDAVAAGDRRKAARRILALGLALMAAGYALNCLYLAVPPNRSGGGGLAALLAEPPFVPPSRPVNYWNMNQQAGSISYLVFGAGLSAALYALFVWACDLWGFRAGVFRTFGTNALAAYTLHMILDWAMKPFLPAGSPPATIAAAFAAFFALTYFGVRALEARGIYWRM